jgi:hypothetical protein
LFGAQVFQISFCYSHNLSRLQKLRCITKNELWNDLYYVIINGYLFHYSTANTVLCPFLSEINLTIFL